MSQGSPCGRAWDGAGPAGAWRGGAMFSSVLGAPLGMKLDSGTCLKAGGQWSATTPQALCSGAGYVLGPPSV